jgi:hypothetical protein
VPPLFDAAPDGESGEPDDDREDWVCPSCARDRHSRCADEACRCCAGHPEDLPARRIKDDPLRPVLRRDDGDEAVGEQHPQRRADHPHSALMPGLALL